MVQPGRIKTFIEKNDIKVYAWGKSRKLNHLDTPSDSGVYALYWGATLQYIGRAKSLRTRLSQCDYCPKNS